MTKISVKKSVIRFALFVAAACALAAAAFVGTASANNDDDHFGRFFGFFPGTLVLSRSVYVGTASTVTIGETLPIGMIVDRRVDAAVIELRGERVHAEREDIQ